MSTEDVFAAEQGESRDGRARDLRGTSVIKHGALYLVSDQRGDVRAGDQGLGLYEGDTRVLSRLELLINGSAPEPREHRRVDGYGELVELAADDGGLAIRRERHVAGGTLIERVRLVNRSAEARTAELALHLEADFADIFEVRGAARPKRGQRLEPAIGRGRVQLGHRGLDGLERWTFVTASGLSARRSADGAVLVASMRLAPAEGQEFQLQISTDSAGSADARHEEPARAIREWRASFTPVPGWQGSAHHQAVTDLRMLLNTEAVSGERYFAAGLPWYSTLFGRDSIIAALQLLRHLPELARDTLTVLARLQATEHDGWRDAQPGKILHELRTGEMARLGEIPHTPYYGTVDATPLWLMLLDAYVRQTGDRAALEQLWPHALAALRWIDEHGDTDGDGFVEYERHSRRGLANQGWKDSQTAVRFHDGRIAEGPIALVEVQAYVHAARLGMTRLAGLRGEARIAERQERAAALLQKRFEDAFWMADAGTYALALDGLKRPVDAVASNAGHALWTGTAPPDRAASVARVLLAPAMWSGWGIRTLARDTGGYDPLSYHEGSVWPHDNAICAAGFARYGLAAEARMVARTILEAAEHFPDASLPELFSGEPRSEDPPRPYPMACSPQAWAAGAVVQLHDLLAWLDG